MQSPPIPASEANRIATLRSLLILDTLPEARFDAITAYAASAFAVPSAMVTLIDETRQWFKSRAGSSMVETSRDISFCGHAILGNEILEVRDARTDVRFADNPFVTGPPGIRFYAGCPLIMGNGEAVGTLCLFDVVPRRLGEWERDHLAVLGKMVAAELQGWSAEGVEGHPSIPPFHA